MGKHLDFLNKNLFRKYPLVSGSSMLTSAGESIPQELFTSARFSTVLANSEVYISQIIVKDSKVSILITDNKTGNALGSFTGIVLKDYSNLAFTPFISTVTGRLTTGLVSAFTKFQGVHNLSYEVGRIEDSLVYCYTPPILSSIITKEKKLTGNIALQLTNLQIAGSNPNINFTVVDTAKILSRKDYSASNLSCTNQIITSISGVEPNSSGNIDIYGILPVAISTGTGVVGVTTGTLTLSDFCQDKNKRVPPVDETEEYYADILTTDTPEWHTW